MAIGMHETQPSLSRHSLDHRSLIQTKEATSYFAGKISGMLMRYNLPGDHPVIGCSAPDFELEHGTRLAEFLHDDKGLLLDCTESEQL